MVIQCTEDDIELVQVLRVCRGRAIVNDFVKKTRRQEISV